MAWTVISHMFVVEMERQIPKRGLFSIEPSHCPLKAPLDNDVGFSIDALGHGGVRDLMDP